MQPLTTEQQRLAAEAVPTAVDIARRYAAMFPEHAADIESSAYFGAVRAASEYRPDEGAAWSYWKTLCIRGEVREFLRSGQAKAAARTRQADAGHAGASRKTRRKPSAGPDLESAEDARDLIAEFEGRDRFERLLRRLPAKHREICRLVYLLGHTPAEAGRSLGLSQYRGCTLHQEALAMLRKVADAA